MYKMNYLQVRDALLASDEGEKLEIHCDGGVIVKLRDEFPKLSWSQRDVGHFMVTVPPKKTTSSKKDIENAMQVYPGGMFKIDHPSHYVRVVVTQYNKAKGTNFRVKHEDGNTFIYKDGMEREYVRQSEYEARKKQFLAELEAMRPLVRPDDFFEYIKPDYDNGIAPNTEADLEVAEDDWNIPKRGDIYLCDDCGVLIPEEMGAVDLCSSCQSDKDAAQTQETVTHEALKAYDCTECGEELLAYSNDPKICDMCRGIE